MAAPSCKTMIYYQTTQGLVEAADYAFAPVLRVVLECSRMHYNCRQCPVLAECKRWWDAVATEVTSERDAVYALAEFRRLAAHEDAQDDRDEHLGQPPHKADRQRKQHDPLEEPAIGAIKERVVPQQ